MSQTEAEQCIHDQSGGNLYGNYHLQDLIRCRKPWQCNAFDSPPASVSTISNPAPTSLTTIASNAYPKTSNHLNHRNTGGILSRLTKNPAYVIKNRLCNDDSKIAIPPLGRIEARRKFCMIDAIRSVATQTSSTLALTNRVKASPYSTRINKNLKNLAAL
jgi:hypothetical protein